MNIGAVLGGTLLGIGLAASFNSMSVSETLGIQKSSSTFVSIGEVTPSDAEYPLDYLDNESSEIQVLAAVEAFRSAQVTANSELIIKLSAPNLTFGHSNGVVQTREEFAEIVRTKSEIFKRIDLSNRTLEINGDTAIERHQFDADIVFEGKLMNFNLEVIEVWKDLNGWRLVARQAFNI